MVEHVEMIEDIRSTTSATDTDGPTPSSDIEYGYIDKANIATTWPVDDAIQKRLVRKQDYVLLPLMAMAMLFGYLDRGNIGNARLLGMQKDLHLSSQQYLNCVMMFFFGYMIIELPAGMALRYAHPRYVFAAALTLFGLFSTLFCVSGYGGVLALRFFIGLAEAVVNNAWIYISLWYMPNEMAMRTAGVYSMTPIAGAASGLISYGVGTGLNGTDGIAAWKWLFLIEGVCTIGFAIVVLFLLPGLPETVAKHGALFFRNRDERHVITQRLAASQNTSNAGFQTHQVIMAIKDPKLYLSALLVGPVGIGIGAFNIFLPTFIKEFGYTALHSQLLSVIPYAVALVSLWFFSYMADRLKQKALITIFCMCLTCAGFIILICTTNPVVGIVGSCFVAAGAYPAVTVSIAWVLTIHGGYTKRATAVWGFQLIVQTYSIVSTQVYRNPPRFFLGHGLSLGLYAVGVVSAALLLMIVKHANAARDAKKADFERRGEFDVQMQMTFEELGDSHPAWRYIY